MLVSSFRKPLWLQWYWVVGRVVGLLIGVTIFRLSGYFYACHSGSAPLYPLSLYSNGAVALTFGNAALVLARKTVGDE